MIAVTNHLHRFLLFAYFLDVVSILYDLAVQYPNSEAAISVCSMRLNAETESFRKFKLSTQEQDPP